MIKATYEIVVEGYNEFAIKLLIDNIADEFVGDIDYKEAEILRFKRIKTEELKEGYGNENRI
jgi:hypothetical protein